MGLFNSGKNDKVEKVSKYERHYNVPSQQASRRRSSKHRSQQNDVQMRAMSQPPLMRLPQSGFYPGMNNYIPPTGPIRYPMIPFDLSKYPLPSTFANPMGMSPMNLQPTWNHPMAMMQQQQFPFQQQQQPNWPMSSPASNYPYLQNIQF